MNGKMIQSNLLYPELAAFVMDCREKTHLIPKTRQRLLDRLAGYLAEKHQAGVPAQLVFICTHNSRRSQLAQVWGTTAAAFYGQKGIRAFSGGTEVTAFNPRAVAALERAGFRIDSEGDSNPAYRVFFSTEAEPVSCWSKRYDDPANPEAGFAALMTCSEADADCPFVPGAEFRLPLTFEDPKEADGTPAEEERYDARNRQIATEILYLMHRLKLASHE